jgi:hypothetical protein
MSIVILYADLRNNEIQLKEKKVPWRNGVTAFEVLKEALTARIARQIEEDLVHLNDPDLTVSWNSLVDDSHSEIGGVGSLDWEIEANSILVVTYEDESTTDQQLDEALEWMLAIYEKHNRSS